MKDKPTCSLQAQTHPSAWHWKSSFLVIFTQTGYFWFSLGVDVFSTIWRVIFGYVSFYINCGRGWICWANCCYYYDLDVFTCSTWRWSLQLKPRYCRCHDWNVYHTKKSTDWFRNTTLSSYKEPFLVKGTGSVRVVVPIPKTPTPTFTP